MCACVSVHDGVGCMAWCVLVFAHGGVSVLTAASGMCTGMCVITFPMCICYDYQKFEVHH